MRVRRLIEVSGQGLREGAQKIVLPVSRGFDQKGTQLCWAYSSLSVIESNYLARHPDSKLPLSRRAMQFITMKDRYTRQVHGTENFISERGIAMDAMALIRDAGLVAFADYKDIADAYGSYSFATQLSAAVTLASIAKIAKGLEAVYSDPPLKTHLGEQEVTRGQLVKEVVGNQIWQSFARGMTAKRNSPSARSGRTRGRSRTTCHAKSSPRASKRRWKRSTRWRSPSAATPSCCTGPSTMRTARQLVHERQLPSLYRR